MRRLVVVALLLCAAGASADDEQKPSYRAVVDRVELEPASITGQRLRVFLSALSLDGQQLDLTDPKSIRLYIGAGEKKVPYALGSYAATGSDVAIVVLVQATQDFADALPTIADALDRELLGKLNDRAQIAILPFGETPGTGKLTSAKATRGKIGTLASDGSVGDPAMLDAIDRALIVLRRATAPAPEGSTPAPPLRKVVILISDGRDRFGDRDRVTAAGKRAAKEGVRIHAVAYSPNDVRRPLLVLGELSKRSLGTFRWPGRGRKPTGDSWGEAFKQLDEEIEHQYVVTYFVNAEDDVAGKKLHVVTVGRTEATSNEVKVPDAPTCSDSPCDGYCAGDRCVVVHAEGGRGVLGWLLLVGGIGVGGVLLLGLIGFAMTKMQQQRVPQPQGMQAPAAPPRKQRPKKGAPEVPMIAPGMLPNGRPIPALLVMTGPRTGERLLLRNGFMIGKQPGCDLQIEDGYTSTHHAQIGMDNDGNCAIYDRGSTNGTFVNGARIQQVALSHGHTLRIGSIELRFLAQ